MYKSGQEFSARKKTAERDGSNVKRRHVHLGHDGIVLIKVALF